MGGGELIQFGDVAPVDVEIGQGQDGVAIEQDDRVRPRVRFQYDIFQDEIPEGRGGAGDGDGIGGPVQRGGERLRVHALLQRGIADQRHFNAMFSKDVRNPAPHCIVEYWAGLGRVGQFVMDRQIDGQRGQRGEQEQGGTEKGTHDALELEVDEVRGG